ncbi:MAG TPA: PilZ domain-containing protein [Phycisphaerae bacterium]|nr:PilZ domain-containing protein [Phycisphaerales bacterium]HRX85112.1 PilZ domain-containing protein [Phycisphaerae bacterium]
MEKLIYVDEARKNEIVVSSIEKEIPCVLTRRSERGWQPYKSHFVAAPGEVGRMFISADEGSTLGDAPALVSGERVGLTFRRGHKKCMCATMVLDPALDVPAAGQRLMKCVELQWPDALQELQRRVYHRATPPGRRVHVRFWPGGVAARAAVEAGEGKILGGMMLDLSAGGISILTTDVAPDSFVEGDAIGCAFAPKPRGEMLVLDATFRHLERQKDGGMALGLQFVGLETSERGRQMLSLLAGVVTDYQRGHARQQRERLAGRFARS